jgi:glyoxylase-like metal-dependent hydrolase (beta-lactamase superfamily II)
MVFTGDTLFYRGIGTTLMPGSSRSQLIESIQTRLMVMPNDTTVYPGHGRDTTIGANGGIILTLPGGTATKATVSLFLSPDIQFPFRKCDFLVTGRRPFVMPV